MPPSPQFIAAKHQGGGQVPALIVLHSTVSPCKPGGAQVIARFFRVGKADSSAHYVVDPDETIQMVGDHTVAWHCGYNQNSIGIEMCDMPDQNRKRWDDANHRRMETRAARLAARLCLAYGIPTRRLTNAQLADWARRGKRPEDGGIVTHAQMSEVFKKSSHWDPGEWRRVRFMRRVRARALWLKVRGK